MHEGSFTEQIVETILTCLSKEEGKPVRVRVKVGEMLHLVPESVKMHYDILVRGTRLEGVMLDLVEVPVEVRCQQCNSNGGVEDHHLLMCQTCGSLSVDLLKGKEIEIDAIELSS